MRNGSSDLAMGLIAKLRHFESNQPNEELYALPRFLIVFGSICWQKSEGSMAVRAKVRFICEFLELELLPLKR